MKRYRVFVVIAVLTIEELAKDGSTEPLSTKFLSSSGARFDGIVCVAPITCYMKVFGSDY